MFPCILLHKQDVRKHAIRKISRIRMSRQEKCLFPNQNKQKSNKIAKGLDCKNKISIMDKIA